MSESRSREQYRWQRALNISGDVRSLVCFCVDTSGSMSERLSVWGRKTKIDLLSEVLMKMVKGFRIDPKMKHSVAISIVTYNKYAQVKEPFQDAVLYEDLNEKCVFHEVSGSTNMSNGLRISLNEIRSAQQEMTDKDQSSYTPMLVFMTDGEPVGDNYWKDRFGEIRNMVSGKHLHVFPVGIGKEANMRLLSGLLPDETRPRDFETHYCMQQEDDFERVFDEIKRIIFDEQGYLTGEQHSMPAYMSDNTMDTQSGTLDFSLLMKVAEMTRNTSEQQ